MNKILIIKLKLSIIVNNKVEINVLWDNNIIIIIIIGMSFI